MMLRRSFLRLLGCLPVLFTGRQTNPEPVAVVGLDVGRTGTKGLCRVFDGKSGRLLHSVDVVVAPGGRMVAVADSRPLRG